VNNKYKLASRLIIISATLLLFSFNNIISADSGDLYLYFYNLSKQLNSTDQKINFLQKSIELNPSFKDAYIEIIGLFDKAGDTKNANKYRELLQQSAPQKPSAEKSSVKNDKPPTAAPALNTARAMNNINIGPQNRQSAAGSGSGDDATNLQKQNQQLEYQNEIVIDYSSTSKKKTADINAVVDAPNFQRRVLPEQINKPFFTTGRILYSIGGAGLLAAGGYYAFEKINEYKNRQFIKQTIYYSAVALSVGVSGYLIYKYLFAEPEENRKLSGLSGEPTNNAYLQSNPLPRLLPQPTAQPQQFQPEFQQQSEYERLQNSQYPQQPTRQSPFELLNEPASARQTQNTDAGVTPRDIQNQRYQPTLTETSNDNQVIPLPPLPSDINAGYHAPTDKLNSDESNQNRNLSAYPQAAEYSNYSIGGKININSASINDLLKLDECDEFTAQLIINYRDYLISSGRASTGYTAIDDLYKIPLIQPDKIDALKKYLVIR